MPNEALDRLAAESGILAEFRDAHGNRVRIGEAIQRGILKAMGLEAQDEAQVVRSLEALEREQWQHCVAPVHVVRAGQEAAAIEVVLPADCGCLCWKLALEAGGAEQGEVEFATLPLLDSRPSGGRILQRRRLLLGPDLPWGYHRLQIDPGGAVTLLVLTPGYCWLPPALVRGERLWGLAAQLYLVRSAENWGIGDFSDLRELIALGASKGADVIGVNPLHVMFSDAPEHASPYSPASRLLLNVLNIDVMAIPEMHSCDKAGRLLDSVDFQRRLTFCREQTRLDYTAVADIKMEVLALLYAQCRRVMEPSRWHAFQDWCEERGETLEHSCRFLALREHFARQGNRADWRSWPAEYRDAGSPEVRQFAHEHRDRVEFMGWLQWIAEDQLAAAAHEARERDMQIGLYRDLAVGADPSGAETWINGRAVITGARIGVPPDIHNPAGQNWGLPPFDPRALRAEAYQSFIQLIRANMRHAGALRIDHVMALQQLYWIPDGCEPKEGAYVRYPLRDLAGILALESHRQQCLVIGEDLGTVPEGLRECLAEAKILSYRVLLFEQNAQTGQFLAPSQYPPLALAVTGSHDLPTLRGWWSGADLELKERLGLFPEAGAAERQRAARQSDKAALLQALRDEGLLDAQGEVELDEVVYAAHAFLGRSASALVMVQLDDLTDEVEQVNVPATSEQHPNWRRRLSLTLHELAGSTRLSDIATLLAVERSG